MAKFDYVLTKTIDDAVHLLNEPDIRSIPLAGGTDVYVALRVNPVWFDRLVDIRRIPELNEVSIEGDHVKLGAALTFSHAIKDPILQKVAPFLVDACKTIGGPAVRNCGTFGGNVSNAAACADSLPALVCLEAVAHLRSSEGERQVKVVACLQSRFLLQDRLDAPLIGRLAVDAQDRLGAREADQEPAAVGQPELEAVGGVEPGDAQPTDGRRAEVEDMLPGGFPKLGREVAVDPVIVVRSYLAVEVLNEL